MSQRTASETIGTKTFAAGTTKITLPWVPTLLALCPGTGISSEYEFGGTTIGTQSVATGVGRPSTALRGLKVNGLTGDVAYQPTTVDNVSSIWTGSGMFTAAGALGQGTAVKLTLVPSAAPRSDLGPTTAVLKRGTGFGPSPSRVQTGVTRPGSAGRTSVDRGPRSTLHRLHHARVAQLVRAPVL